MLIFDDIAPCVIQLYTIVTCVIHITRTLQDLLKGFKMKKSFYKKFQLLQPKTKTI